MKIQTRKGFTLTELLIVMAIIVVLAAVAVPTFGKQLETSRETGDMEIIRNAYTEALSVAILDAADGALNGKLNDGAAATPGTSVAGLVVSVNTTNKTAAYTVALADMNKAAFSQRKANGTAPTDTKENRQKAWTYVSSTFMDRTVPIVNPEVIKLQFTFKIVTSADITGSSALVGKGLTVGDVVLIADPTGAADATGWAIEELTS